ncbi:MAG TPA: DUF5110 domain-containing protein, partial [Hanamia sp.]|nr:DUF5110 domain-containing protein [Hanamia sp.]
PLFVKQGSIIPMRKYASSIQKGNNNTLILQIYPGSDGEFNLLEDDGTSNDYLKGKVALTILEVTDNRSGFTLTIHPLQGNYSGMNHSRKWILKIHSGNKPKNIKVNNQDTNFRYDQNTKITTVETSYRSVKDKTEFEVSFQ